MVVMDPAAEAEAGLGHGQGGEGAEGSEDSWSGMHFEKSLVIRSR